jgi:hypothetical protein
MLGEHFICQKHNETTMDEYYTFPAVTVYANHFLGALFKVKRTLYVEMTSISSFIT